MDSEKDEAFSTVMRGFDVFEYLIKIPRKINNTEFSCVLVQLKYFYSFV